MTLRDLMDATFDETWFCIVTPDGEEHLVWNADYIGGLDETIMELDNVIDCEVDDIELVIRDDPEKPDVFNADKVPMMWVAIKKTDEDIERERVESSKGEGI